MRIALAVQRTFVAVMLPLRYLLVIAAAGLSGTTALANYRFEHVITEQNLTIAETNVIFQDSEGFMWFGGGNGLARYNGHTFTVYRHDAKDPHSISHSFVWEIVEDHLGKLWVATPNGLNLFDREKNQFIRYQRDSENPDSIISNDVYTIYEDKQRNLWIGTRDGLDLFDRENEKFIHFQHDPDKDSSLSNNFVLSLYEDHLNNLWVGTQYGGLNLMNRRTGQFTNYKHHRNGRDNILDSSIRDIKQDKQLNLWLATDNGLYKFDQMDETFEHYSVDESDKGSLSSNRLWKIYFDSSNTMWISTDHGGLNVYNRETDSFEHYRHNAFDNDSLASDQVRDIFEDSNGNLWIALFPSGVDYINRSATAFSVFRHDPANPKSLNNNAVNAIHEADKGKVWVGTEGGLNLLDRESGTFKRYKHDPNDKTTLGANAVLAIEKDAEGNYWFGTWSGGLSRYNATSDSFVRYLPDPNDENSLSSTYIWALLSDSQGYLWIGSQEGKLDRYDPKKNEFKHYTPDPSNPERLSHRFIRALHESNDGTLWIGTLEGLNKFDRQSELFTRYLNDPEDPNTIIHNYVLSIFEDSENNLWIGTSGGLSKLDCKTGLFTNYTSEHGLPNDTITGIQEGSLGFLWLSTLRGLSRFDPATETFDNFYRGSGLAGNVMNKPASMYSSDGELYFGSTQGLTIFRPESISNNTYVPPVHITDFKIFNKSVEIGGEDSVLQNHISRTKKITLDYFQTMISFEFAALNFQNPERNSYKYKMEGFDQNWIEAGNRYTATYTNLNPGEYTFRVLGSNNDQVWNEEGASIDIEVLPPPWKTWWANTLYIAAILGLLYLFVRQQKIKIEYEQQQVSRLKAIDKMKDEFLANTSHELRTPLNGIIGLTEALIDDTTGQVSEQARAQLQTIAGSGRRLSSLINDILDFSKIKSKGLELELRTVDFNVICRSVTALTAPLAAKKNIEIITDLPDEPTPVWADEDRLQQILYNLIGNALKFTPKGHIRIYTEISARDVDIFIEDTGIGIPESDMETIFESFSQAHGGASREYEGTGLGLSVAKNLIRLHNGEISVTSEVGVGSTFKFNLKRSDQLVTPSRMQEASNRLNAVIDIVNDNDHEVVVTDSPNVDSKKFHVLVVDDDEINRQVLIKQLSLHEYRTSEAASGEEAVRMVNSDPSVDLVLLDVMMPRMTGYEAAKIMRKTKAVHELPIIFITAKHLASDLVEGFLSGGNDFLVKPVSKNELLSRTKTHLRLLDFTRNLEKLVKERTQTLKDAHDTLETLDNVVKSINSQTSLEGLVDVMLKESLSLFRQSRYAAFWLWDDQDGLFKMVSGVGETGNPNLFVRKLPEEDAWALVDKCRTGTDGNAFIIEPNEFPFFVHRPDNLDSLMLMAINIDEQVTALLIVANETNVGNFNDQDRQTFEKLQTHAVSAVSKARILESLQLQNFMLGEASLTDPLTGLRNRRFFIDNIYPDVQSSSAKYEANPSASTFPRNSDILFMLIDIDSFKDINDNYGHKAGDLALVQFSTILSSIVGEEDYLVRWGGEEFMVVIRFCSRDKAGMLAEQIREAVQSHAFDVGDGRHIKKTCSIGFSYFPFYQDFPNAFDWEQIVDIADKSLSIAKRTGFNNWLGIYGRAGGSNKLSYKELAAKPEKSAKNRSLVVQTSITSKQDINWS